MIRRRGFTLIEMSVALVVLSLIMLATVTALRTLGNTQVAVDRLTLRNDEIRSVSSFLRDALESAILGGDTGGLSLGGVVNPTLFEISPTSLVWRSVVRFGENAGGSYVVRVALEGSELVLRWQRPDASGRLDEWNKTASRAFIGDVQSFDVAYRREFAGPWLSEWDEQGAPAWVRLQVRAGERFWPDIVMQVAR